jgi:hypothetical protein
MAFVAEGAPPGSAPASSRTKWLAIYPFCCGVFVLSLLGAAQSEFCPVEPP